MATKDVKASAKAPGVKAETKEKAPKKGSKLNLEAFSDLLVEQIGVDEDLPPPPGWLSTGCDVLDYAISGQWPGGFPISRAVEIYGPTSVSKSFLLEHGFASAGKAGGLGIDYDTEGTRGRQRIINLGIRPRIGMKYYPEQRLDKILEATEKIIHASMNHPTDFPICVGLDSLASSTIEKELESEFTDAYMPDHAKMMGKAMRRLSIPLARSKVCWIVINQVRKGFKGQWTTFGGDALSFWASLRLSIWKFDVLREGNKEDGRARGIICRCTVEKSKVGAPFAKVIVCFDWKTGVDNAESLFLTLKEEKKIKSSGPVWKAEIEGYEPFTFQRKEFAELIKDEELKLLLLKHLFS